MNGSLDAGHQAILQEARKHLPMACALSPWKRHVYRPRHGPYDKGYDPAHNYFCRFCGQECPNCAGDPDHRHWLNPGHGCAECGSMAMAGCCWMCPTHCTGHGRAVLE